MVSLKSVLTANMLYTGCVGLAMLFFPLRLCDSLGVFVDFVAVEPGSDLQAAINKSVFKVWGLILVVSASTMSAVFAGGHEDTIRMYGFAGLLTWVAAALDWWYVFVPAMEDLGQWTGGLKMVGAAIQLGFIMAYLAGEAAALPARWSFPKSSKVVGSLGSVCIVYMLGGCAFYFNTRATSSLYGLNADEKMLVLMNRCGFHCLLTLFGAMAVLAVHHELTMQKVNRVMICMWVAILSNMLGSSVICDLAGATGVQFEVDKVVCLVGLVLGVRALQCEPRGDCPV